jgi:hypothetical protein
MKYGILNAKKQHALVWRGQKCLLTFQWNQQYTLFSLVKSLSLRSESHVLYCLLPY